MITDLVCMHLFTKAKLTMCSVNLKAKVYTKAGETKRVKVCNSLWGGL